MSRQNGHRWAVISMRREADNMAQPKENKMPGGRKGPMGPKPKLEHPGRIFKQLMGYTLKDYWFLWLVIVVCIFTTVYASLQGTMFMKTLIDKI